MTLEGVCRTLSQPREHAAANQAHPRRHKTAQPAGEREVDSCHVPVTQGSRAGAGPLWRLATPSQALCTRKTHRKTVANRCKALETVGWHPGCNFPAAGTLRRQPGSAQASQADPGEESGFYVVLEALGLVLRAPRSAPSRLGAAVHLSVRSFVTKTVGRRSIHHTRPLCGG